MRRRPLSIIVLTSALAALGLSGWVIASSTSRTTVSVTCTSGAGMARTWTSSSGGVQFGGAGSASTEAAAPNQLNGTDKASYSPVAASANQTLAQLQQLYVGDAIEGGLDPVTAARQFGPWTLHGAGTAAEMAHAVDPATYGWHCP